MKSTRLIGPLLLQLVTLSAFAQKSSDVISIKPAASFNMEVNEPSDLVWLSSSNRLLAVSDNGYLAEVNLDGTLIRRSPQLGYDLEGLTLTSGGILVVDEMTRRFTLLESDFNRIRSFTVPYSGGRNRSFEALTTLPDGSVLAFTEKSPIWVYHFDTEFRVIDEFEFSLKLRDVSAITWHEGDLWILSDEDRTVLRCTWPRLELKASYRLPIINPEGMAFDGSGNLYVCSDDREKLYFFSASNFTP